MMALNRLVDDDEDRRAVLQDDRIAHRGELIGEYERQAHHAVRKANEHSALGEPESGTHDDEKKEQAGQRGHGRSKPCGARVRPREESDEAPAQRR